MIAKIFAPFMMLAHLLYPSQARVIDRTSDSVVHINMMITSEFGYGQGSCSGIVIAKDRVLTAAHCIDSELTVDKTPAESVQKKSEEFDLALVNVSTNRPAIAVRTGPLHRFEQLYAVGYAYGWNRLSVIAVKPFLIGFAPEGTDMAAGNFVQGGYIGGMSGGPVVDAKGRLVGIVQRGNSGTGYGVGVLLIRAFLLGTDVGEN